MTTNGWLQIAVFVLAVLALTKPLGLYLVKVYDPAWQPRGLSRIERFLYRAAGVDAGEDQHWTRYARSLLVFSLFAMLGTYLVLRLQHLLPMNPDGMPAVPDRQAFETAASFTTNTNWQSYGGETTMSHFSQMFHLAFHNFVSAAAGMGVAFALARALARKSAGTVGNFWSDLVRGTLYLFLPLSLIVAVAMVQQGVIQAPVATLEVTTLEGATQRLAMGPVASQESIKQLGTNGGGFFNANAAHPFENPTPLSNFLSLLAIFAIPSALVYAFGRVTGHLRHAWTVWGAMAVLFIGGVGVTYWSEANGNPLHAAQGADVSATAAQSGGNMEGKEVRFGIANSSLYAVTTTAASCGAVNAMHDSMMPLGGLVLLLNMQLGELVYGGVGAGLYGMLMMVVLSVFIAGLMIGRTPEYLGKRVGRREIQMVVLYVLASPMVILGLTAIASVSDAGLAGLNNAGPHGLSEMLYAFTSTTANNGSAFAGLTGSTDFYNTLFGLATLIGRFGLMVPVLALAGFLAERRIAPTTAGTLPLHGPLFLVLLVGVILIVGALTFFPVLALGPVVEHLLLLGGTTF
jgi:potassium-transporting ATPase potassium-binding subunit